MQIGFAHCYLNGIEINFYAEGSLGRKAELRACEMNRQTKNPPQADKMVVVTLVGSAHKRSQPIDFNDKLAEAVRFELTNGFPRR